MRSVTALHNAIKNARGKHYYGIHFYPGVAEYRDEGSQEPYRVFLNENTLRIMDKSFTGCPIFVDHVDSVTDNIDELRSEVDGWVLKSFYNEIDGKHWVEFLVTSELGERAIKQGMRLSNAYVPKAFKTGGLWNGVSYEKEITDAEYEHLAIVENPRYEESVIMTPEQFKAYNEKHAIELKRIANSKDKQGAYKMKLNFFKRSKVETSFDPDLMVTLPNSKQEISIAKLVNDADEAVEKAKAKKDNAEETSETTDTAKEGEMARPDHLVTTHKGEVMNVADLVKAHADVCNELDDMKKDKDSDGDDKKENAEDDEDKKKNDDDSVDNAEDEEKKKKENADAEAAAKAKDEKKKNAIAKATRIKNAQDDFAYAYQNAADDVPVVELSSDRLARGKSRYGSGR